MKEFSQARNLKCMCCKEIGHLTKDCPRDPNLKTHVTDLTYQEEMARIMQIKDYRKLFSDTIVTTTHFLKKCIRVPKVQEFSVNNLTADITKDEK